MAQPSRFQSGWRRRSLDGLQTCLRVACYARYQPGSLDLFPSWLGLEPGRKVTLPPGFLAWYHSFMAKQTVQPKKRRGPVPTGKGLPVQVRLQPSQLAALDAWIAKRAAPLTRPEAIRAMMETILHILSKDRGEKPAKKAKAK
jgi:hypothetical protein